MELLKLKINSLTLANWKSKQRELSLAWKLRKQRGVQNDRRDSFNCDLTKSAAIAGGGLNRRGKIHGHGVCAGEQCGGDKNTFAAESERELMNRNEHGNFLNRMINKPQQGVFLLWSEIQSTPR